VIILVKPKGFPASYSVVRVLIHISMTAILCFVSKAYDMISLETTMHNF